MSERYEKLSKQQDWLMLTDSIKFYMLITFCGVSLILSAVTWALLLHVWFFCKVNV